MQSTSRLPRLALLTDRRLSLGSQLPLLVREACMAGIRLVILGENDLEPRVHLSLARKLANIVHQYEGLLLVVDRVDLAMLSGADGALLLPASIPAADARIILGKNALLGSVIRMGAETEHIQTDLLDLVLAGPYFSTHELNNLEINPAAEQVRQWALSNNVPVYASGGMTPARARLAFDQGVHGAVISEVAMETPNMPLLIKAFLETTTPVESAHGGRQNMTYDEFGFGLYQEDITKVAERFHLDLAHLAVEFFRPERQGIFVETVGERQFRIHVSLEEGRIIAVKQIAGPDEEESAGADLFGKYKAFMK